LRVIKTVIERNMEPTVGGLLQIGGFPNQNFHISGVTENVDDGHGNGKTFTHYVGFDLSQAWATKKYPLLFIPHGYVDVDTQWPIHPMKQKDN
jgi:hypothetical protein